MSQQTSTAVTAETSVTPRMRDAVLRRAMPVGRRALPGTLLGILADACVVGLLGLSMWLIVRAGEQPPILFLTFAIVGVRALAIGRAAFRYAERLSSHDAALAQLATLRAETFISLIPRIPGAIESHRRGEVLAAFVDDVDQLQDEPLRVRQPLWVGGTVTALSVIIVALISPLAALVLTVFLAASGFLAARLAAGQAGDSDRAMSAARAGLVDALLERFTAAEVLAAFGAQGRQRDRIAAAEARLVAVQLRRAKTAGLTAAILTLGSGLATILTLLLLAPSLGTALTAPLFAAAVVVPAAAFEVFAQIPAALVARRAVRASADRVASLTETPLPAEISDPSVGASGVAGLVEDSAEPTRSVAVSTPATPSVASRTRAVDLSDGPDPSLPLIAVSGLSARYPGAECDAISGLDFTVVPGETLVVTGESGAGKSTLALALVRFLEYGGSYRVRGREAREIGGDQVRSIVGLSEQTPHLFDADLRQNLKFARETASDDELMAALDRVGLAGWAEQRGGLDARVGEHGALVSGGQAQRIGLARAILADFPVVVLDEPTAGVDREVADRLLLDLLSAVPEDRAVILITHAQLPDGIPAARLQLPSRAAASRS